MSDAMQRSARQAAACVHNTINAYKHFRGEVADEDFDDISEEEKHKLTAVVLKVMQDREMTAEGLHKLWMEQMIKDGWRHGEFKDSIKKTHPGMVGYAELEDEQKLKDVIFLSIVHSFI